MAKQQYEVEIGSDSIRGAGWLFGAKKDYTYAVPEGTVAVKFKHEDLSSDCLNIGDGNGKATLSWKSGDSKAHVHAWVNGAVGSANQVRIMSFNSNPSELMERFQLEEEDVLWPISDVHIQDICLHQAIQWHLLPAVLRMVNHKKVVSDIRREGRPEEEMRAAFFSEWQRQMGSDATYKELICALLRIGSKEHAEYICQLVKDRQTSEASGCSSFTRRNDEVEKLKAQLEEKDRRLMELEAKFSDFIASSGQRTPQNEVRSNPVTQNSEENEEDRNEHAVAPQQRNTGPQEFKIEIGSGNLRGAFGFGAKEDFSYPVPKGTIAVKFDYKDLSPDSLNLGGGNGKATLHWRPGDEEAHVHAWVNGAAGAANEVAWTVTAVMIIS